MANPKHPTARLPEPGPGHVTTVLLDVDGTLVDSNDAHALAWVRAFAEEGVDVPFEAVRRLIGMGGDKLIPRVSPFTDDSKEGKRVATRRQEIFAREFLPRLQPFRDATRLVAELKRRGMTAVAASSAKAEELRPLLRIANAEALLDGATSSSDADESKPSPDIIHAALEQAHAEASNAVMIGDTPYDIEAATAAGVRCIAFRCGGWADKDLAGAIAIYDGPWDLLARLDESPLATTDTGVPAPK
jgi:HAD superfamily hydrolase (TIGR01509 family)